MNRIAEKKNQYANSKWQQSSLKAEALDRVLIDESEEAIVFGLHCLFLRIFSYLYSELLILN